MSNEKFTPGPWFAVRPIESNGWYDVITGTDSFFDSVCSIFSPVGDGITEANADLIAAAPEMYADEIMLCNELDSLFHCFEQISLGVKFSPGEIEMRRDRIIAALSKSKETQKKARGEK